VAKAPAKPRPSTRRRRRSKPERKRSNLGRAAGALLAVGSTATVLTGLATPVAEEAGETCGGTERWNVKVANDPAAAQIDPNPQGPFTVAQLNQITPGPLSPGGRMAAEKKQYTVRGFLSYFKREGGSHGDGDYHLVITDQPGVFEDDEHKPPNGRSIVVELPDAKCFRGASGLGPQTSLLGQSMGEARVAFEKHVEGINGKKITTTIPVTVTGVGFFDRAHGQTGRATEHSQTDGRKVSLELHPVTEITFDAATDPD
jgi:hypothetical protein